MGTVSACGWGNEALAQAFAEGRASLQEIDRSSGYHTGIADFGGRARKGGFSSLAGVVEGADLTAWLKPAQARRMSRLSRSAVVAAKMAVVAARMAVKAAKMEVEVGAARMAGGAAKTAIEAGATAENRRVVAKQYMAGNYHCIFIEEYHSTLHY